MMRTPSNCLLLTLASALVLPCGATVDAQDRPNVILVITDDQGYGDVGAHGNPLLETPHLDAMYARSVRLTNFHVDPTCSPTRAALMSGRYSTRAGVWHTIAGRSLMPAAELTLAEIFRDSGYRTAHYGKWHLGDAYPLRPQDQGFDEAFYHGGGGVGQTPDYWGNDYFDGHYFRQGRAEAVQGYCTDVWFEAARDFVRENRERPFFLYLATNAPHGPYYVADKYREPYAEAGDPTDRFLGMIANIDENLGRLVGDLRELGLEENTLFIFMTDNGTAQGEELYNAGMRGKKGSEYDGGHRVPCYWYWPAGGLSGGRDVDQLTAHIDIRNTLIELCGVESPAGPPSDGVSLTAILRGDPRALRDRTLVVHSQRILYPRKWRKCAVMTDRWRLVNGQELYEIRTDGGQQSDVAADHPQVVSQLRAAYDAWWESLEPAMQQTVSVTIGNPQEPVVDLTAHDWLNERTPWHQGMIERGPWQNGPWAVTVDRAGRYEITLSRWPLHLQRPVEAVSAKLSIQDQEIEQRVDPSSDRVVFTVSLQPGVTRLQGFLEAETGRVRGPYYVRIRSLDGVAQVRSERVR